MIGIHQVYIIVDEVYFQWKLNSLSWKPLDIYIYPPIIWGMTRQLKGIPKILRDHFMKASTLENSHSGKYQFAFIIGNCIFEIRLRNL